MYLKTLIEFFDVLIYLLDISLLICAIRIKTNLCSN